MSEMTLTADQQRLLEIWQAHEYAEFVAKDPAAALATMVDEPHVLLIPSGLGGVGRQAVRRYYEDDFIPNIPSDMTPTLLSHVVGNGRVVEEAVFEFTHGIELPWLLPGVEATGRRVRLPVVALVQFEGDKIAYEHLYYDHATLLAQLGLIETGRFSVAGAKSAATLLAAVGKGV